MTATDESRTDEIDVQEPDPDDDLFDESFDAPKKTNRVTVILLVALLVVAGFAGGVLVQKKHDTYLAAVAVGAEPRRGGNGGGRGQGASASAAPGAAGARGGADGAGAGAAAGSGGGAAAGAPVVEGTIRTVDADAIEVTDASGAIVRVFVPRTASVTTRGLGGLAYNMPVSVTGTKQVDGSVTATSVTVKAS